MPPRLFHRVVALALCVSVALYGFPRPRAAAAADAEPPPPDDRFLRSSVAAAGFASLQPDTTEFDFPEEEDRRKLFRDIAVFVVASAFVAYFIIKVFIEEDQPPPPPEPPRKPPPGQ